MASYLEGNDADVSSHRANVEGTQARSKRLQRKTLPAQVLDRRRVMRENADLRARNIYPAAAYHTGRWVQPSDADTDMSIRKELISGRPDGAPAGSTPYGVMSAGQEVIEYLKEKKDQEEYWLELQLAGYLIDSKKPESQENAIAIFPELRDVPEQNHTQNLAIQEAIRTMLRDGKIAGKEDNSLIMHMLRADYALPYYPAWDPEGIIMNNKTIKSLIIKRQYINAQKGIFSPRQWGVHPGHELDAIDSVIQKEIKLMLLRRLYPGMRDLADDDMNSIYEQFSKRLSPLTPRLGINNSVVPMVNYLTGNALAPVLAAPADEVEEEEAEV